MKTTLEDLIKAKKVICDYLLSEQELFMELGINYEISVKQATMMNDGVIDEVNYVNIEFIQKGKKFTNYIWDYSKYDNIEEYALKLIKYYNKETLNKLYFG